VRVFCFSEYIHITAPVAARLISAGCHSCAKRLLSTFKASFRSRPNRLERKLGRMPDELLEKIKEALRYALDL
jgi:hypothetical protein